MILETHKRRHVSKFSPSTNSNSASKLTPRLRYQKRWVDEETYTTVADLLQDHLTTGRSSGKRGGGYEKGVRKLEKIEKGY